MRVIDLFGKELLTMPAGSAELNIDLTPFAEGVYYCSVQYEDPAYTTDMVKFVKIRKE